MNNLSHCFLTAIIALGLFESLFPMNRTAEEVSFYLHRGYMIFVKGSIGPLEDLTFLIDTGATSTVISARIAKKLKLQAHARRAFAWGKAIQSKTVILHGLRIGSVPFHSVPAAIADLRSLPGIHLDAILGLNALKRTNFSINYQSKKITFGPVEHLQSATEFDANERLLIVQMQVENQSLRLLVDTGAKDLVLFRECLEKFPSVKQRLIDMHANKTIHHLGAPAQVSMVRLPQMRLGETEWKRQDAFLLKGPVQGYPNIDGVLGVSSLKLKRIHFDFRQMRISWER